MGRVHRVPTIGPCPELFNTVNTRAPLALVSLAVLAQSRIITSKCIECLCRVWC
jgi:hypothetical protein